MGHRFNRRFKHHIWSNKHKLHHCYIKCKHHLLGAQNWYSPMLKYHRRHHTTNHGKQFIHCTNCHNGYHEHLQWWKHHTNGQWRKFGHGSKLDMVFWKLWRHLSRHRIVGNVKSDLNDILLCKIRRNLQHHNLRKYNSHGKHRPNGPDRHVGHYHHL